MSRAVQDLNVVVLFDLAGLLTTEDQVSGPGDRIADPSTSNFPDGPGPGGPGSGPGAGPEAPTSPPHPAGFNRRLPPEGRNSRDKGSGVQPARRHGTPVSPPPTTLTRTYSPFAEAHTGEMFGSFRLGPVSLPLVPPTDLSNSGAFSTPVDYYGDGYATFGVDGGLAAWAGTTLPTVAELNAICLANGWAGSPPTNNGPYQTSSDS